MNYVLEYTEAINNGLAVSRKIKALYQRESSWIIKPPEDFPFYFDPIAGTRPITFIEKFCKQSKGKWAGKPLTLELFQKAKLQLAFGWLEKSTGKRRFREVFDLRGRKCGKSSETAGVELYMLTADGEGGAETYCCANKLDQAKIIFNEAVNMRAQSPVLSKETKKRQSDIYYPKTFSFIKAIAADTKTMDGLNAHFFSLDELHEARDNKIYSVMKQSQSAREQPLAWLITTAGFVREAFFDSVYSAYSKVALWEPGFEDYRLLPLFYELDSRDEWHKPQAWEKANPGLGKIKNLDSLKENVEKAKREPGYLPTVLTKDFNIPENSSAAWLPYEAVVNTTEIEKDYLYDTYAIGGCDLSATTDLTCATLLIRRPSDPNFYVLQKYFLPKSRVDTVEDSNKKEAPYRLWAEQGHLEICPGATVDYHAVTSWFADMLEMQKINPLWICYDAALSGYWTEEMKSVGFDMEKIRQGPITWTYPMKRLEGLFREHKIIYNNNPMLRWCALNTAKKSTNRDGIESIQPVKCGESKRIDGLVSLLNAFVGYCNHEEEFLRYIR